MSLTINNTANAPISLKALLIEHNPFSLAITIVVEPGNTVHVYDDLISTEDVATNPIVKHKLEFIVNSDSTLHYHLSMVPEDLENHNRASGIYEKELIFRLAGKGANAQAHGSCFAGGSDIFKFKTLQDHQVADTTSTLLIKGVLDDQAKLTCNSMIQICKGAQRSNALQANKNIVLSKKARAISIPQLEIEANDVSCKHGAAVSNINDEHMFYLQSRGLSLPETRKMLIQGFLAI